MYWSNRIQANNNFVLPCIYYIFRKMACKLLFSFILCRSWESRVSSLDSLTAILCTVPTTRGQTQNGNGLYHGYIYIHDSEEIQCKHISTGGQEKTRVVTVQWYYNLFSKIQLDVATHPLPNL